MRTIPLRSDREFRRTIFHSKNNQVPGPDEDWMEPVEFEEAPEPCPQRQLIFVELPFDRRIPVEFHLLKQICDIKEEVSDHMCIPESSFNMRIVGGCKNLDKNHLTVCDCGTSANMTLVVEPNNSPLLGGNEGNEKRDNLASSLLPLDRASIGNELFYQKMIEVKSCLLFSPVK